MPDIDFQRIELNLIPKQGDEPVVFYASQYETTRPFIADLFWGDTEFTPGDDCWAEIDIRKNDDNLVVITEDVAIDNNEVSVILPVQALTCIGKNLGQVKIYAGEDQLIAALNFILEVQPDPLAGGVTSETDIDNLTQQIEDIAEEVIGEDYYDKTEVDALLSDKADVSDLPDMSNYYTKSQVYNKTEADGLLSDKADISDIPDMSNYYTKSQIDNTLINNYATYGYLGSHYYNKSSVENLISDAVTLRGEAEGDIASFNTALAELPDTLNCYFNVLSGITELNVTRTGVNLLPTIEEDTKTVSDLTAVISDNGTITLDGTSTSSGSIIVAEDANGLFKIPNGGYIHLLNDFETGSVAFVLDLKEGGNISPSFYESNRIFTIPSSDIGKTVWRIRIYFNSGITINNGHFSPMIALTSSAIPYEQYNGQTITLDLNGTYTEGYVDPLNGKLYDNSVTPAVEHDITRKWIYQAEGVNNFFSDGNDKTYVKYKDTIQHYIDTRL